MMGNAIRLEAKGLNKSFSGIQVLHDVSFEAVAGRILGVVGENGSGKSTTMNLLTGVLQPDAGSILLNGGSFAPESRRESDQAGIAFIQQELNIFPNLSVAENLFLLNPPVQFSGLPFISRKRMHDDARALLRRVHLDVPPSSPASTLSAGERQLLEIARALAGNARIFIFDEPTSSLTAREADRLFEIMQQLRDGGAAILFISHNLEEVLKVCGEVVVMQDGRVTLRAESAKLTPRDLVLAMVGRPIEALFPERQRFEAAATVLEVSGLTTPGFLEGINLKVGRGEIVGIAGLMGSGRSELARAVFGLDEYTRGSVRVQGKALPTGDVEARLDAGVGFLTEDRRHEGLMVNASIADNMALAALPMFASRGSQVIDRKRLLGVIGELGQRLRLKSGDISTSAASSLSGGTKATAAAAKKTTAAATASTTSELAQSAASSGFGALSLTAAVAFMYALFSTDTARDVLLAVMPLAILVGGQLLVLLLGQIDLSMTAVMAMGSIASASVMTQQASGLGNSGATVVGILTTLAIGVGVGLFNGMCVAILRIPSFIVTLAVMMAGGGAAVWYASSISETISIGGLPDAFRHIGYGTAGGIPIALILSITVLALIQYTLARTVTGKWLYAIGHNSETARISGVPIRRLTIAAFVASGLGAALATVIYTSRIETGLPTLGQNMLLDIVGAAVIGGVSLFGGRGSVWMALGGAAFLCVLDKSLQLLGLSLFVVLAVKGFAIIIAAAIDVARSGRWRRT